MKKLNACSVISLFSIVSFFSCSQKNEDPVPVSKSVQNEAGVGLTTSAANIKYSKWISANNLSDTTIDDTKLHIARITSPEIAAGALQAGSVLVYVMSDSAKNYPLPYTNYES